MSYRVRWHPKAIQDLGNAYLQARLLSLGSAVTKATNQIERHLSNSPHDFGEGRGGIKRVAFVGPLVVKFSVLPDERVAHVQGVQFRPPRPS